MRPKQRTYWVYLLKGEKEYKIGYTNRLKHRFSSYVSMMGKGNITLIGAVSVIEPKVYEHELHLKYKVYNSHGEWFSFTDIQVKSLLDEWKNMNIPFISTIEEVYKYEPIRKRDRILRPHIVNVNMTKEEKEILLSLVKDSNMNISEFIRSKIFTHAISVRESREPNQHCQSPQIRVTIPEHQYVKLLKASDTEFRTVHAYSSIVLIKYADNLP